MFGTNGILSTVGIVLVCIGSFSFLNGILPTDRKAIRIASLVVNVLRILAAVTHFLTLWRIQTVVMSEYFIATPRPEPQ